MKFVSSILLTALSLMAHSQSFAAPAIWIGGDNNNSLADSDNWNPGVPTNDVGTFAGVTNPFDADPKLFGGTDLIVQTFHFPSTLPNESYVFDIAASTGISGLTFSGAGASGIQIDNNQQQTFNIGVRGIINFEDSTSAYAGSGTTKPIYNLSTGNPGNSGRIEFKHSSTAGSAIFNSSGDIDFFDNSSAQTATINSKNADLRFAGTSKAASSTLISENRSFIDFFDDSSAGAANITAKSNSVIDYESTVTTSFANINLLTGSSFYLFSPTTQLSIGSLAGDSTANIDLNTLHLQVGTANLNTTYAGTISDTGAGGIFDKIGTGTFIFSGTGTAGGGTNVLEGTYVLNGTLTGSNVVVAPGATLRGIGSINNASLTVNGKVSPGNSIGTLSVVNGPYVQGNGSTYAVEVNGVPQSSLINVTGTGSTATIGTNTTVSVSAPDGTYSIGHNYLILHADQGVTGTYSQATQNISQFIVPNLTYSPAGNVSNVFLNLTTNFSDFAKGNAKCVASILDATSEGSPNAAQEAILLALAASPSVKALQHSLNSLTGAEYTHLTQLSEYTDYRFARRLFSSVRSLIKPSCCDACGCCTKLESWARVEYDHANVKGNHNVRGLKDNSWDISVGTHAYMCPNFIFGIAGNYSSDSLKLQNGRKSHTFQTGQGALYGVYQNSNFYVFSDLIVGQTWSKNFKRHLHAGSIHREAKSKPEIFHGKYYAELGAELSLGSFVFEPFFGADVGWYSRKSISEHGAGNLNRCINKKSGSYWDTYLGVHLLECNCDCVNISGDLYWQHRFGSFNNHLQASFHDFGNLGACRVEGNKLGRDGIVGTVNFSTCLCDNWEIYAELNGQGWKHFSSYGGTLGLNYSW